VNIGANMSLTYSRDNNLRVKLL